MYMYNDWKEFTSEISENLYIKTIQDDMEYTLKMVTVNLLTNCLAL